MKYTIPVTDHKDIVSRLKCIIEIPQIEDEAVDIRAEFYEDDEYAKVVVNGKERDLPDPYRIEIRRLLERDGIEVVIWNTKSMIYDWVRIGILDRTPDD